MAFIGLGEALHALLITHGSMLVSAPQYWTYPTQTLLCGALLWWFWPSYSLQFPKKAGFTILLAILVLAIWISPQAVFGRPHRLEGFNPDIFEKDSALYFANLVLRFARLVIVVPLLEEIFWRGFLLRYLIKEDFAEVPFGSFSWLSFSAVSLCFALAHQLVDFWPALICSASYNLVAYKTKSLGSCVLAHAVTNLLLGIYIMKTGQWGFW